MRPDALPISRLSIAAAVEGQCAISSEAAAGAEASKKGEPKVNFDVMSHLAQGAAAKSYWELAHTSVFMRDFLLAPGALRSHLTASGYPANFLPGPQDPHAAELLADATRRVRRLDNALAASPAGEVVIAPPPHVLPGTYGRLNTCRVTPKHIIYLENYASTRHGRMHPLEKEGTFMHKMPIAPNGALAWQQGVRLQYPGSFLSTSARGTWALFARSTDRDDIGQDYFDVYNLDDKVIDADSPRFKPRYSYHIPTSRFIPKSASGAIVHIYEAGAQADEIRLNRLELRESGPVLSKIVIDHLETYSNLHDFDPTGHVLMAPDKANHNHVAYDLNAKRRRAAYSLNDGSFSPRITPNASPTERFTLSVDGLSLLWRAGTHASLIDLSGAKKTADLIRLKDCLATPEGFCGTVEDTGAPFTFRCFDDNIDNMDRSRSLRIAHDIYLHTRHIAGTNGVEAVLSRTMDAQASGVLHPDLLALLPG